MDVEPVAPLGGAEYGIVAASYVESSYILYVLFPFVVTDDADGDGRLLLTLVCKRSKVGQQRFVYIAVGKVYGYDMAGYSIVFHAQSILGG